MLPGGNAPDGVGCAAIAGTVTGVAGGPSALAVPPITTFAASPTPKMSERISRIGVA